MNLSIDAIPNAKWLGLGMLLTLFVAFQMPLDTPWLFEAYFAVGMVIACAFMAFHHPNDQPNRIDIALCIPILAGMWPVILFAMLLSKPWNDPKWIKRNSVENAKPDKSPTRSADEKSPPD